MVLGFLDQLQIFWQLYQIKLLGPLIGLGPLKQYHLIYPWLLSGFDMPVFFTKSYGTSGLIFGLILSFHSYRRLWEVLHKNTQLMLEFLKAPFLVLRLSNYILMTFLVLSVGFLSIMMTLLSTLKCDQVFDQWQQLDIAAELESDLRDNVNLGSLSFIGITFLDVRIIWTGSIGPTSLFSREV